MNNISGDEFILEFQLRKPFKQLATLVEVANDILSESNSASMLDIKEGKVLGIHIFRCRRSFASLTIMAMVRTASKSDIIAVSKYNYAATFNCSTRIELEKAEKLDHGPKIRIILGLPCQKISREQIERQFRILDS